MVLIDRVIDFEKVARCLDDVSRTRYRRFELGKLSGHVAVGAPSHVVSLQLSLSMYTFTKSETNLFDDLVWI